MIDLEARRAATKLTMDKYRNRPFDWRNRSTCIHLARTQLRNLGHRPPPIPSFRSALGARRALATAGFASIPALLDSFLERIPPAAMLVGDLAATEGDDGFEGIVVCAGAKMLGWNEVDPSGLRNLIVSEFVGAWRA
ncbi:DUF6950 family protein [Sphingobium phenoxybenzoativorans]|uniref:DUF6950 family protein n=1 Tax=Sphingobium phenoxybenzoativorans TaxID=1592790 RepID=UPI003CCE9031